MRHGGSVKSYWKEIKDTSVKDTNSKKYIKKIIVRVVDTVRPIQEIIDSPWIAIKHSANEHSR